MIPDWVNKIDDLFIPILPILAGMEGIMEIILVEIVDETPGIDSDQ